MKTFIPANNIDLTNFKIARFANLDGETLLKMTLSELMQLEPKYGKVLYEKLHELNNQYYDDKTCMKKISSSYSLRGTKLRNLVFKAFKKNKIKIYFARLIN